eukprot:scaffold503_cov375-Pinguiococcus_pyrenoidosus.AAC.22
MDLWSRPATMNTRSSSGARCAISSVQPSLSTDTRPFPLLASTKRALRGAGSNNFGVVTQIEMQAYPTFGDIAMGEVAVPVEDAPRFFAALGTFEASIPREIFGFFTCSDLLSGAVTYVGVDEYDVIRGINYLEDEFPSLLQIDPGNMSVSRISWVEDAYAEDNMYGNLADSWTGFITKEMATEETFQTIFDELGDLLYSPYLVVEFCFIGGAINDKEPDFNAFAFRDTQYLFSLLEVVPGDLDDAQEIYEALGAKLEVVFDRLKPLLYGTLLNFPVDTSSAEEYLSAYHGEHLESLQAIKRKYDPENRFRDAVAASLRRVEYRRVFDRPSNAIGILLLPNENLHLAPSLEWLRRSQEQGVSHSFRCLHLGSRCRPLRSSREAPCRLCRQRPIAEEADRKPPNDDGKLEGPALLGPREHPIYRDQGRIKLLPSNQHAERME